MTTVTVLTSSGPYDITVDGSQLLEKYGARNAHLTDAIASYLSLLDSSPLQSGPSKKPVACFRHFLAKLVAELKETVLHFSSLFDQIVSSTTIFGGGSITGTFLPEMIDTPIFREYHHWFRTGDPHLLAYISSFLLYLKKLDFDDVTFHETAFRGWEKNEEKLANLTLPDHTGLRDVIHYLLRDLEFNNPFGKYGPGHVSERYKGPLGKSLNFTVTPRLVRAFGKTDAHDAIAYAPVWKYDNRPATKRFSRLVFVPKNLKTSRSICIEPNAEMYFQQMILQDFVDYFDDSLSKFIDLRDQSRNKCASLWGSVNGDIDTIDLSSASDLVSMDLVRLIFPRHVLYKLIATRSSLVEVGPKDVRRLKKFAPMGSALCFPIQCIIFLGVNILAAVKWRKGSNDYFSSVTVREIEDTIKSFYDDVSDVAPVNRLHSPLVYGDDIVVDSKLTATVTQMLSSYGFEVNSSKSYMASCAFRESCGGFYWHGHDITPLQYRIKAGWNGTPITQFSSACAHVNKAYEYSYYRLRAHHIGQLRRGQFPLLFSNEDVSCSIKVDGIAYNPHLRHRYNKDLCRTEVRRVTVGPKKTIETYHENHESYGLIRWWDAAVRRDEDARSQRAFARADSFDSRPVWGWTPYR